MTQVNVCPNNLSGPALTDELVLAVKLAGKRKNDARECSPPFGAMCSHSVSLEGHEHRKDPGRLVHRAVPEHAECLAHSSRSRHPRLPLPMSAVGSQPRAHWQSNPPTRLVQVAPG